jgi:hypothetical protein
MKRMVSFLKTSLLGGFAVILPITVKRGVNFRKTGRRKKNG